MLPTFPGVVRLMAVVGGVLPAVALCVLVAAALLAV
jgi:hypothetical protein